ncbi:MAG: hypothetical protein HUU37_06465 [Bdellovibrionales bacterium]|nr:hypothetical protein [Bdellovibrionales bacterium]
MRSSYDLIVVGDQLSGLFLAASVAEAGRSVLVIEGKASPIALFEVPSGKFLSDLVCEPVIGLQEGSKLDAFLKRMGLYQNLGDVFPEFHPALQVVSSKNRVDFSYRKGDLEKEVSREFPERDAKAQARITRVLGGQEVSKASFAQVVADAGLETFWEHWGDLQPLLYGSSLPSRVPYPLYKRVFDTAAQGVRHPLGGRAALKERLIARVKVFGGAIKRNAWVEEIVFEKGRLAGAMLSSYEGFVRSPAVAGAMAAGNFVKLIPEKFRPRRLEAAIGAIRPRFWRMTFTVVVPAGVVPEGMGDHVCIHDTEDQICNDGFLQIQRFGNESYSGIRPDEKALVVRMLMPFEPRSLQTEFMITMMKRSLRRLQALMPALREYRVHPDPDNLKKDSVFLQAYQFKSLGHIPPAFIVYDHSLSADHFNLDFMEWSRFGIPGLGICSRDVFPAFGLMGEVIAGMEYAHRILHPRK